MGKNNKIKELRSVLSAYTDGAYYSPMWHCIVPILGITETRLLSALFTVFLRVESLVYKQGEDGKVWVQIARNTLCYFTGGMSIRSLSYAKDRLVKLGFIETEVQVCKGVKQPLWWAFNFEQFGRFFDFAKAFDCNFNPLKYGNTQEWAEFYSQNPEIVDEFKSLVKDFENYIPEDSTQKEKGPAETGLLQREGNVEGKIGKYVYGLTKRVKGNLPVKPKKSLQDIKPDKFIEFWNTQPSVPKCKIGSKAYEMCREFFKALQRYQVGTELFPLDTEEQQRLQLKILNRSVKSAPKCGPKQIPMRPDKEMFEMIEEAAKVYQVGYAPVDKKKWLPTALSRFLYNDHSRTFGRTSMFLEKLWARPPQTLDDAVYDSLWENADEDTRWIYETFQKWYNINRGREEDDSFLLKDHKRLLGIARDWRDYFYDELRDHSINGWDMNRFDDYVEYIKYVVPEDCLTEDMPLGTFKKGGYFWKRIFGEDSCLDNE